MKPGAFPRTLGPHVAGPARTDAVDRAADFNFLCFFFSFLPQEYKIFNFILSLRKNNLHQKFLNQKLPFFSPILSYKYPILFFIIHIEKSLKIL